MSANYMLNGKTRPVPPGIANMPPAVATTERREVSKLLIVDRLIAASKAEAAMAALGSDAVAKLRWDAATAIYADDPAVLGLLAAIGADPAVILAP